MLKKAIAILNFYRLIFPTAFYLGGGKNDLVNSDLKRIQYCMPCKATSVMGLWYALIWNPPFRAVFYYRMSENEQKKIWKIISKIQLLLLPNVKQTEISGEIGKGFVVFHGQGTIIHCSAAGENLAVWQNVTVGRNPSHIKNGSDKPILGNNVNIYTGSIVAGGIVIGDNVDIGAGSVVLKDVPSNCVVAGNPAKIVKRKS